MKITINLFVVQQNKQYNRLCYRFKASSYYFEELRNTLLNQQPKAI